VKLFGLTITRTKAPANLRTPESRGGWYPVIREAWAGAWQTNTVETPLVDVLSHPTVFACISLISSDIAKMRLDLVEERDNDVWVPVESPSYSPVIRMPNGYQTQQQFWESWFISLLTNGNTYVLLHRDLRGVVVRQTILDPWRVRPLVAPDGSVFYELKTDDISGVPPSPVGGVVVPASEIIHDRYKALFHPLIGVPALYAAGIPAILGLKIHINSTNFFANGSRPSGILTAPTAITEETADRLKTYWATAFTGANAGNVAVVENGMTYVPMSQPADHSQLNEQWMAASQAIADAFKVPFYLVGGPMPTYNNIQAQTVQYFTQCLQPLVTNAQAVYEKGVGLWPDKVEGRRLGVQFKTNDLLLMDSATMMSVIKEGIAAGVLTPNEGRAQINLEPVDGGDTPYLQQQYIPLSMAAKATAATPPALPPAPNEPDDMPDDMPPDEMQASLVQLRKNLVHA
jgi:HK97 family phage portal protein